MNAICLKCAAKCSSKCPAFGKYGEGRIAATTRKAGVTA